MKTNPLSAGSALRRREFLKTAAAGVGGLALGGLGAVAAEESPARPSYQGPNLVLIRYGGGARRRESIEPATTYSPYLCHDLLRRGTLFRNMEIAQLKGLNTSHGEGTLNIVTGKYDQYKDIENKFLAARFEPKVPTLFEYFRKSFVSQPHDTLIVNGENRPDEEFYTFSNHFAYGINFRSNMLSLYRFKQYLFQRQIDGGKLTPREVKERQKELSKWDKNDYRTHGQDRQGAELEKFWERWREYYGDSGMVNPRGDRLLTELATRALRELRPRLLMVNYSDCDYVHWGNLSYYTRGIAIMDEGIRQIVEAVERDEAYRDNTVFVIVPDCGRDSNPAADVPCQHHFNSKSAHEIFCLMFGKGIRKGQVIDKHADQSQIVSTIGRMMGFKTELAESQVLQEAIA